ncbi:hypothetical protein ACT29H_01940 [Thermophagus sp. OGC60D27]|uniref:hypothetical protein n=1 Tax=Thermophagus sp. OGC60D27 TaxID=3458415 RepID=UPI00403825EA
MELESELMIELQDCMVMWVSQKMEEPASITVSIPIGSEKERITMVSSNVHLFKW